MILYKFLNQIVLTLKMIKMMKTNKNNYKINLIKLLIINVNKYFKIQKN